MGITVQHSKTATTPDATTAEIRPSHWNESHVVSVSLAASEVIKFVSAGISSMSSGNLVFSNANGITFGLANGVLTGSHNGLTSQSVQSQGVQSIAAGGNTVSAGGVQFSNANGISFGLNGSTLTGSVSVPAQTNQSLGLFASSQTTGQSSSSTVDARSLSVVGAGGVSVGLSGGSLVISGATGGGGADGFNRLAAGTQTAGSATTVQFADSNGITFGMSGSNQITASHDGLRSHRVSAPNGSSSVAGVSFANSNGVSWSVTNGSIVASVAAGGGTITGFAGSNTTGEASSTTFDVSSLPIAGYGNVSVGYSAGSLVISGASGAAQTITQYATGNTAGDASTGAQALSSMVVRGAGVASVGYSNDGALIISVPAGGGGGDGANILAAGTQTATSLGSVRFEDSNGVTFGMSGSTRITASVRTDYASSNHSHAFSAPGGSSVFQTLSFANSNGVSFSNSNGSLVGSVATTYAGSNHSHGNPTLNLTNLSGTTASNSAGLTLSLSAASQSAQTMGLYASSQTTAQSSSSTFDARSLSIRGAGVVSVGMSGGEVIISATAAGGGGADGGVFVSAAGSSQTAGNIVFSNSNGVSFGMNGSTVTASHNGLTTAAVSNHSHGFSAPGGSSAFQTLTFANSFGVSWSNSNGSVVASVNTTYAASNHSHGNPTLALTNLSGTTASNSAGLTLSLSAAAAGGAASQTVSFTGNTTQASTGTAALSAGIMRGAGIVSVGISNGSTVISAPDAVDFTQLSVGMSSNGNTAGNTGLVTGQLVLVGGANITLSGSTNGGSMSLSVVGGAGGGGGVALSAGAASVSNGTAVFSNSNGVSFGLNGSTVTASHNGLTSQSNQALSAANGSFTFQTAQFSNANGVSFGTSAGSAITASVAAQSAQTMGVYASSNTTAQSSSSTVDARSLSVRGVGAISVGLSGGELLLSVAAGAQSNQTIGMYALGNTTQNSSTTLDARTVSLNGLGAMSVGYSNGSVQLSAPATSSLSATGQVSISVNGSTISIGVPNPSTDTNGFFPNADLELITHQQGNGTIQFDPELFPTIAFDRIAVPIFHSNTSNSSGSHTLSVVFGLYSRNGSSLSLISSTSSSTNFTGSGTVGSYSLYSGIRLFTIPLTMTVTAGKYWLAFGSITTTGGAAGQTIAHMAATNIASNFVGMLGVSHATTQQFTLGQGVYTATSGAMPASVAFSQIRGSDSGAQRPAALMFMSGTVP